MWPAVLTSVLKRLCCVAEEHLMTSLWLFSQRNTETCLHCSASASLTNELSSLESDVEAPPLRVAPPPTGASSAGEVCFLLWFMLTAGGFSHQQYAERDKVRCSNNLHQGLTFKGRITQWLTDCDIFLRSLPSHSTCTCHLSLTTQSCMVILGSALHF